MPRTHVYAAIAVFAVTISATCKDEPRKIIIVKADDVRGVTANWTRFFEISKENGVKVSAGIICNSLRSDKNGYFKWLTALHASGAVEFWNHGWDHKRWKSGKKELREFSGSGYDHQKKHVEDSQKLMKKVLGTAPVAFGAPFNATDADTVKVLSENVDLRLIFCYKAMGLDKKVWAPMHLRGEHDGTGKPNFSKFKKHYKQGAGVTLAALQFHPNGFTKKHFVEYTKIIDFLKAEGWSFMLPSEVVVMRDGVKKK